MAESTKKIITLDILEHYDLNIKKWVDKKIKEINTSSSLVFANSTSNFPLIGQEEVLYITSDSIYQWNTSMNSYVQISATSSGGDGSSIEWGPIKNS